MKYNLDLISQLNQVSFFFSEQKSNFEKADSNIVTTFDIPYAYDSVMHYPSKAFSKNGNHTIIAKVREQLRKF